MRASWLDEDPYNEREQGRSHRMRGRDQDDDYGREDEGLATRGRGWRGPFGDRGYGEGRGFGASQGEDRFRTGVFMGGAEQDYRSGGQYQRESILGARSDYGSDYAGGGYMGRDSEHMRPQWESRGGYMGRDSGHMRPQWESRGGGFRGQGPKNYMRTDQRITEDLNERLTDDDAVDAGDIEVQVKDGVVTLTGTVTNRWMKHRAEDMAEACAGVRDVENRIRVTGSGESRGAGAAMSSDARSMERGSATMGGAGRTGSSARPGAST
jgi:hypothetical protein